VNLYKRLITPPGDKIAPALRVMPKKAPPGVAPHLFGMTKRRSSRLDWRLFGHNSVYQFSVSRP